MLIVDTREHKDAIKHIIGYFESIGMRKNRDYMRAKLIAGDYMDFHNPFIVVDRKQNILELSKNCTSDHIRFKAEIETAMLLDMELVILVEQDRYKDGDRTIMVRDISDLMLWSDPHTQVRGEKVYRILASWCSKYRFRVEFCNKADAGRRILEILKDER